MNKIITLNELPMNLSGKIHNINCKENIKRRMLDLGMIQNTSIKPILKSPLGDPRAYEVRGSIIAIREEDSKKIEVIYWTSFSFFHIIN